MPSPEKTTHPKEAEKRGEILKSIAILHSLKDDWRDEIPQQMKGSYDPSGQDIRWKVRAGWFAAINNELSMLKRLGVVWPAEIQETIDEFKESRHQKNKIPAQDRLTSQEDIERGNQLLDTLLKFLEANF